MGMIDRVSKLVAQARWKAYKLSLLLSLGRLSGKGPDSNFVYCIATAGTDKEVQAHLVESLIIESAHVESLNYDESFPPMFQCHLPMPERHLYRLRNVAISLETGAVWIPGKRIFVESLGNIIHFYAWGGLIDVMRPARRLQSRSMVVVCANLGYYHWLLDAMAQVLIAREKSKEELCVAVLRSCHEYVRQGLDFFGIEQSSILWCDGPIEAKETFLVARNPDLGLIPRENLRVLREMIFRKLDATKTRNRKVYISRRNSPSRAINFEDEIEQMVGKYGFEICYFERMPFEEQMQTVSEASVVMGVHGAGLSNIIAGRNGLTVIEILNPDWLNPCFMQLAHQLGFRYRYLMLDKIAEGRADFLARIAKLLEEIA